MNAASFLFSAVFVNNHYPINSVEKKITIQRPAEASLVAWRYFMINSHRANNLKFKCSVYKQI